MSVIYNRILDSYVSQANSQRKYSNILSLAKALSSHFYNSKDTVGHILFWCMLVQELYNLMVINTIKLLVVVTIFIRIILI